MDSGVQVRVLPVPPREREAIVRVDERGFLYCPVCGCRTKTKVLSSTELHRFPLFCGRCKNESVIEYSGKSQSHEPERTPGQSVGSGFLFSGKDR